MYVIRNYACNGITSKSNRAKVSIDAAVMLKTIERIVPNNNYKIAAAPLTKHMQHRVYVLYIVYLIHSLRITKYYKKKEI